jgi:hypothetical protein
MPVNAGIANFNAQNQDVTDGTYGQAFASNPYHPALQPTMWVPRTWYLLSGYYRAGNSIERWVTNQIASNPPSGHALANIQVEASWQTLLT